MTGVVVVGKGHEHGHSFHGSVLPFQKRRWPYLLAYELDIPEARGTEERHPVYRDLGFAIKALDQPVKVTEQRECQDGHPTSVGTAGYLEKAPHTAALVAYTGCLGTGKWKTKPDGGLFSDGAAHLLERDRYHKHTRNKHIAHSPNASDFISSAAWIRGCAPTSPIHDGWA